MNKDRKKAVVIILVCNAILISLLELIVPIPVPVPGVKLGLGNIITIIAIVFLNLKDVLIIVLLRCIVVAVLSKGLMMLLFSISGGILSAVIMWFLYKRFGNVFSIKGISIIGAITHNTAQIIVASVILRETIFFYYMPVLLIAAVLTGLITGSISDLTIREITKRGIFH
ncbi:MAG: Gx transporter family protein [Desulfitobacteriaceae bacterium]|nr:Gx transporter family protein [Desulfitobacteriaceae bacterium]MDD4345974.1 Gx transporter family protein [Desulfitobacteriaceae bacterium]MDD4401005.1 Gx transporter family protein [Desulfitobacteriaceae bacterium]